MRDAIYKDAGDLLLVIRHGAEDSRFPGTGEMNKRYGALSIDRDNVGNGTLKRSKKKSFSRYMSFIAMGCTNRRAHLLLLFIKYLLPAL